MLRRFEKWLILCSMFRDATTTKKQSLLLQSLTGSYGAIRFAHPFASATTILRSNMTRTQDGSAREVNGHGLDSNRATGFQLEDHPIDERRKLRVIVIGAGLSGILAGILLPIKVPGIELTILEKNSDVVSLLEPESQR